MRIEFTIHQYPVPQGSMIAVYNKKLGISSVRHSQGAALAMWRQTIRLSAREQGAEVVANPIAIKILFGMKRPLAQLELIAGKYRVRDKFRDSRPAVAPDIDKLTRAVLDALTGVCYHDDRQVVMLVVQKKYGEQTKITITDEFNGKHPQLSFGMV